MNTIHFSSGKDNWATPPIKEVLAHGPFTLDAAADYLNHVCDRWYGPDGEREDALSEAWPTNERIFLNPPYSRGAQRRFVEMAVDCAYRGGYVVALLPARTDTKLFHDLIWSGDEPEPKPWVASLHFLKGRIKFIGAKHGAPFPSMVVVFRGQR